jgi:hypothetical protein
MDRIAAIRKSLAVFICGLIGSVFVIGLVPACYVGERAFFAGNDEDFANAPLWWGPIIVLLGMGLVPAIWALLGWGRIRVRYGRQWNPAASYLWWGIRLTIVTLLFSALIVSAIILMVGLQNPFWKDFVGG